MTKEVKQSNCSRILCMPCSQIAALTYINQDGRHNGVKRSNTIYVHKIFLSIIEKCTCPSVDCISDIILLYKKCCGKVTKLCRTYIIFLSLIYANILTTHTA